MSFSTQKTTWERIRVEATTNPFGGSDSENGIPYPTWWPQPMGTKESSRIEESFGYPRLSWWEVERGKLFPKLPKFTLNEMPYPSSQLFQSMPQILELAKSWADSASKLPGSKTSGEEWLKIVEPMCRFWDSGNASESHKNLWGAYLSENCKLQLQFFGISLLPIYDSSIFFESNFFKKPLRFVPGKWEIMVVFSLIITITNQINTYTYKPFIPWGNIYSGLYSEKSSFQFPIVQWLKTKNVQQIKMVVDQIRGKNRNLWSIVKPSEDGGTLRGGYSSQWLNAFKLFVKFYENKDQGFSNLSEKEIYDIFSTPEFRYEYGNMIMWSKLGNSGIKFNSIDGPNHILNGSFENMKSTCDFMIWSLMILYIDAFSNKSVRLDNHHQLDVRKELDYKVYFDLDLYRTIFRKKPIENIDQNPPPETQVTARRKEFGLEVDYRSITKITNLQLDSWLSEFRITWRKTAIYHFLDIGEQPWKRVIFKYDTFPQGSKEEKIVSFIRDNFPRQLRMPRFNLWELTSLDSHWDVAYKYQFELYLEWVVLNVNAEDQEGYIEPGGTFMDKEGTARLVSDSETTTTTLLKNVFPDIMMKEEESIPGIIFRKTVSFSMIFVNALLEKGFGSDWTELLSNFGKKIWEGVKDALIEIAKWVKKALDDFLPDLEKYLALAAVGLVTILGGWAFVDAKIRKLA